MTLEDKLIIVTGGKNPGHTRKPDIITNTLSDVFQINCLNLEHLSESSLEDANSLIVFTSLESASVKQLDNIVNFYLSGNKKLIFIHEASIYNRNHEGLRNILGVRFLKHEPYSQMEVHLGHPHFLTKKLPPTFKTEDEIYYFDSRSKISPYDEIFLFTNTGHPLGIERHHNNSSSKLIYLSIGHDYATLEHPVFQGIINNLKSFKSRKKPKTINLGQNPKIISSLNNTATSNNNNNNVEYTHNIDSGDIIDGKNATHETNITEPLSEVGRWNQLSTDKTQIYSQSGIFFPLDPAIYLKKIKNFKINEISYLTDAELKTQLQNMLISFEIRNTDYCNQKCYFCSSEREKKPGFTQHHIKTDMHIQLEDKLIEMKKINGAPLSVRYCGGGDPLCHPRTVPSIIKFETAGINTNLITNGFGLNEEQIEMLAKYSSMTRFSIDGCSAESYSKIHGMNSDAFTKVMSNFGKIAKLRDMNKRKDQMFLGATFLISHYNFHEIEPFCKTVKDYGANLVWIKALSNESEFDQNELSQINTQIDSANRLSDDHFYVSATRYKVARAFSNLYENDGKTCWSALTKAFLQPNGNIALCLSHKDISIGNIYETDVREIWGGQKHIEIIRAKDWEKCLNCFEARFNKSTNFLYDNRDLDLFKTQRDEQGI
jgi:MoaA/NifB/PqqE/SkfB family radical SAM enzyme